MSFLKKIGKGIKTASKQISFKNLVKIASKFDPSGIVGGIQDAHIAKQEEKKALAQQKAAEMEYQKQLAANNTAEAERQRLLAIDAQEKAEYNRQIQSVNTQAVGGKIGVVAGSIGGNVSKIALQTATENINQDLKEGVAKAGANMANTTLNEWFKIHWWKVLLGVVAVGFGIRFFLGGSRR